MSWKDADSKVGVIQRRRFSKSIYYFLTVLGFIAPCMLAGLRDFTVGLDTGGYGKLVFQIALSNSDFEQYMNAIANCGFEIGFAFAFMAYIVVGLTGSVFWYFFVIEVLALLPAFIALRVLSGGKLLWLSALAYYLIFYILSLSAMRQMIAIGFTFLATVLMVQKKPIPSLLVFVVAVAFHKSAVIYFAFLALFFILFKFKKGEIVVRKYSAVLFGLMVVLAFAAVLNAELLLRTLFRSVSFLSRYESYLNNGKTTNNVSFFIFYGFMFCMLVVISKATGCWDKPMTKALLLFALPAFPIYALQTVQTEFIRESYYSWAFFPAVLAYCCRYVRLRNPLPFVTGVVSGNRLSSVCVREAGAGIVLFMLVALVQFTWWYVWNGYYGCMPFEINMELMMI